MENLVEKLKSIKNLSQLKNIQAIDTNELLLAIIDSKTYHLLEGQNISFNLYNKESFTRLAEKLFSYNSYFNDLKYSGLSYSQEDMNALFSIVRVYGYESHQLENFFDFFYRIESLLNPIVLDNIDFFREYLQHIQTTNGYIKYVLQQSEAFVNLIIEEKMFNFLDLYNHIENYTSTNLKLLANELKDGTKLPYSLYDCRNNFAQRIFLLKDEFTSTDFCHLLTLLSNKINYDRPIHNSSDSTFTTLVKDNIDFLINAVNGQTNIPKCLRESITFRDECIKRNR